MLLVETGKGGLGVWILFCRVGLDSIDPDEYFQSHLHFQFMIHHIVRTSTSQPPNRSFPPS